MMEGVVSETCGPCVVLDTWCGVQWGGVRVWGVIQWEREAGRVRCDVCYGGMGCGM